MTWRNPLPSSAGDGSSTSPLECIAGTFGPGAGRHPARRCCRYPREPRGGFQMNVLIVYGSKLGGTAGLAHVLADALQSDGVTADVRPADADVDVMTYDAVVVGGALYAARWHRSARKFVKRNTSQLRERPVFMFSSGPLDDSAGRATSRPRVRFDGSCSASALASTSRSVGGCRRMRRVFRPAQWPRTTRATGVTPIR